MSAPIPSANRPRGWARGLRPLFLWVLLVLVFFGIRTHQRLSEQTRLIFTVSMSGRPLSIGALTQLDGQPLQSGQRISIGPHQLMITNPKADSFSTNLFIWYGAHDLGEIKLVRTTGTLNVKATPPATTISILGPDYSTNLNNSSGINLTVPTDQYVVRAKYPHWSESQNPTVSDNLPASCVFAPQFGAVRLSCNKDGATYRLESSGAQLVDSGSLPATVTDLPVDNYQITASYQNRQVEESVAIATGITNDEDIQFTFGALQLVTVPPGADVRTADGNYLGQTPLLLPDINPQTAQLNLSLSGYEPVLVTLAITADQTNSFSTNLVSANYVSAMREARANLAAGNYQAATQAAGAALNAKPDDADALTLQKQAKSPLEAEENRLDRLARPRLAFDSLCGLYQDSGLFLEHELNTSKPAKSVAAAIITALTNAPGAFEIVRTGSPDPETYGVVARYTFSLGILGGTERECLLVVGQAKDDQTQIWYKVLEYQVQHTVTSTGVLSLHDNKKLIAVNPSRMQMNSGFEAQLREGVQIVTERIQQAIGQ